MNFQYAFGGLDVLVANAAMRNYSAVAQSALLALARTLAHEEAAHGVRATFVLPGSTLTDFHVERGRARGVSLEDLRGQRSDNSVAGRWAEPREIAWPILWLASDEASFVTGTQLAVDGGLAIF